MKSLHLLRAWWSLRRVKSQLPRLSGEATPTIDLKSLRRTLLKKADEVRPDNAAAAQTVLHAHVNTYVADWLAEAKAKHGRVTADLALLGVRVEEAKALYEAHHEDQANRLDDLEGAVSHALERVTGPDRPFEDPEPRNKRRGGKE